MARVRLSGESNPPTALRLVPLRTALPRDPNHTGRLPARLRLLAWGRNETAKGPVILNDQTAAVFAHNQRATGRERVAVDFEHNTVEGMPEYERTREPRPVAGFGAPRLIPGDGLYLEQITTTPEGERESPNYEDLSPSPWLAADGTLVGLHSVALCRAGSVYDLTLNGAATAALTALLTLSDVRSQTNTQPHTTPPMSEKFLTLTSLAAMLSLPDTSTEVEIGARLKALTAPPPAPPAAPDLAPVNAQLTALSARVDTLVTSLDTIERASLISQATQEGKVLPQEATLKLLPTAALKALVADTKPTLQAMTATARPLPATAAVDDAKAAKDHLKRAQEHAAANKCSFSQAWRATQ